MTVKKVGNGWRVVKKDGTLGKRTYTSKQNAQKAQSRGRALAKANPLGRKSSAGKSSKPSTGSSTVPSAGGGKTTIKQRIGAIFRRARLAFNLSAPGWGSFNPRYPDRDLTENLATTIQRYSGYNYVDNSFGLEIAYPSWQGMAISGLNDWYDRRTGTARKITQGKVVHWLKEVIPMLQARHDAIHSDHPLYDAACNYNKRIDGYDPEHHNWNVNRLEQYALGKALAHGYDLLVPDSWKAAGNRAMGKDFNPF